MMTIDTTHLVSSCIARDNVVFSKYISVIVNIVEVHHTRKEFKFRVKFGNVFSTGSVLAPFVRPV